MVEVFDFIEYKSFLKTWIEQQPHHGHGSKAKLAQAAGCQTSYISQVILGSPHLSLEQAEKIGAYIGLGEEAISYLLLLVQKERASTEGLQKIFLKQINIIQNNRKQFKERLALPVRIDAETQGKYFSSWIYASVHLLTGCPAYSSKQAIAERLQLPPSLVQEVLDFLMEVGLLNLEKGKYSTGSKRMHLPHDSVFINQHHVNWRVKAIGDIEKNIEKSLHYSSVVSITKKDAQILREQLMKTIESMKKKIRDSEEEELYSLSADFFKV